MATLKNTTIDDTGHLTTAVGTTAQRPGSPSDGMVRYNTDLGYHEYYSSASGDWFQVGSLPATYVAATGGTVTTSGDYKIHTFTSSGTFTVTEVGNPSGSDSVDYLVVAGAGGGGSSGPVGKGGGGGAGGFRESVPNPAAWTASPIANPGGALPVSVTSYPVTVGAGGAGGNHPGTGAANGSSSSFSTITSAGGGGGGNHPQTFRDGRDGGSGGGAGDQQTAGATGGAGNTPPVSPSQGFPGGDCTQPNSLAGGGGGALSAGQPGPTGRGGGTAAPTSISGSANTYSEGGQGRPSPKASGPSNSGFGGNGTNQGDGNPGGSGGSGVVIIRYKFQ